MLSICTAISSFYTEVASSTNLPATELQVSNPALLQSRKKRKYNLQKFLGGKR